MALVPARGGSRRLPGKNVLPIHGIPLIAYAIHQARASRLVDRVVVSTDDEAIATIARAWGADVPFLRPRELAEDTTVDLPVFAHALEWLEAKEGYRPDVVVHLRPTTPTRRAADIDGAVAALLDHPAADSVRSVMTPPQSPYKMYRVGGSGFLEPLLTVPGVAEPYNAPEQSLPHTYMHRGVVDVARRATILDQRSMTGRAVLPFVLRGSRWSVNTADDVPIVEALLAAGDWDIPRRGPDATTVYLVRHGRSEPLAGRSYAEASSVGLSPEGRHQARALTARLACASIDRIYASHLARAVETASIVRDALGIPVEVDDRLAERVLSRSLRSEVEIGRIRDRVSRDPEHVPPDGESANQAVARFLAFLADATRGRDRRIVAVTHERVMAAALARLFGLDAEPGAPRIRETAVTELACERGEYRLIRFNDTSHLKADFEAGTAMATAAVTPRTEAPA